MEKVGGTDTLITDHVWRPITVNSYTDGATPFFERGCFYMNCKRPITEHEKALENPFGRHRHVKV